MSTVQGWEEIEISVPLIAELTLHRAYSPTLPWNSLCVRVEEILDFQSVGHIFIDSFV